MQAEFIKSVFDVKYLPLDNKPEILLLGRSNVGKSSFINAFTNRKSLAKTSQTPGKTISLNYYLIDNSYYLVDAPGYGYARRSFSMQEEFLKVMDAYLNLKSRITLIFLFIDSLVGPTKDDLIMLDYLIIHKLPFQILLTKADKVKASEKVKKMRLIEEKLPNLPLISISAKTKLNIIKIKNLICDKIVL